MYVMYVCMYEHMRILHVLSSRLSYYAHIRTILSIRIQCIRIIVTLLNSISSSLVVHIRKVRAWCRCLFAINCMHICIAGLHVRRHDFKIDDILGGNCLWPRDNSNIKCSHAATHAPTGWLVQNFKIELKHENQIPHATWAAKKYLRI